VIADIRRLPIVEADTLSETSRGAGGFGSTGLG
jgi:dUTPase